VRTLAAVILALGAATIPAPAPLRAETHPEHFGVFYSYGIGSVLQGGSSRPNSAQMGGVSLSLLHDRLRLRAWKGSLERTDEPIPHDNDADYDEAYDTLATRRWTGWPVDVGLGMAHHKQHAPDEVTGERILARSWGPVFTVARDVDSWRFLALFGELDLHYIPYGEKSKETQLHLLVGLRARI
jgi:hypothetical protein